MEKENERLNDIIMDLLHIFYRDCGEYVERFNVVDPRFWGIRGHRFAEIHDEFCDDDNRLFNPDDFSEEQIKAIEIALERARKEVAVCK